MQIPVVILNWNGFEDTCECVDSLLDSEGVKPEILVVDNGSEGDDASRLRERYAGEPRVRIAANEHNLGFASGMNQALEALLDDTEHSHVALLNNDTIVDPLWLDRLADAADRTGAGIVASRMVNYYERDLLDNAGHLWLNTGEILPRGAGQSIDAFQQSDRLVGACAGAALYRVDMLREIGLFDPYFHTGYEDAEHGLRAYMAGFPTVYCPEAIVYHKVSASIDKVRDFDYSVGIQKNINYTIIKLTPWPLLLLNLSFILLKTVAVPLTALVFGRITLFKAHLRALKLTFRDGRRALAARRATRRIRRVSSWKLMKAQKFFLPVYLGYFRRYMLTGKKTVFER